MPKKPKIDPRVRAKLEELGVDAIRSKLIWILGVNPLEQQDGLEALGDGLYASRRQMQEWLKEKASHESRWIKAGVFVAALAALLVFLAWLFPLN